MSWYEICESRRCSDIAVLLFQPTDILHVTICTVISFLIYITKAKRCIRKKWYDVEEEYLRYLFELES